MINQPNFYPVLNRNDWNTRSDLISGEFLDAEQGDALMLSYAVVNPDTNLYLLDDSFEEAGKELSEVHEIAMANLRNREGRAGWELLEIDEQNKFLMRSGDELTCSDLLIPEVIKEAHDHFGEEMVYIAMPNRFSMVASDNPVFLPKMTQGMFQEAVEDNYAPLTPCVYVCSDGKPVGLCYEEGHEASGVKDTSMIDDELLMGLPCVLIVVGTAKGDVNNKKMKAFMTAIVEIMQTSENKTLVNILTIFLQRVESIMQQVAEMPALLLMFQVKEAINKQLSEADKEAYIQCLVKLGHAIANSSGGFLGFGKKASKDELGAIALLEASLRLSDDDEEEEGE